MDSSPKCRYLSPKSPITTASSPKSTYSGNSENGYKSDSEQEISRSQKPPSATTKAAKTQIRKSKILTERNEDSSPNSLDFNSNFSGTHFLKSQSKIEQRGNLNSSRISPRSVDSDNNDEEGENCFLPDDSPTLQQPYDPIKNYLSPRPKFLRYRPNRRREINLGLEVESKEEGLSLNASTVTTDSLKSRAEEEEESDSLGSCSEEIDLKDGSSESEILAEEEEEDEEFEEREPWSLKWVSKLLLLFLVLLLSTAYISKMNSLPSPPPSLQYIRNLSIEYQTVKIGFPQTELFDYFGDEHGFRKNMDKIPEIHFVELAAVPEISSSETESPEDGMMVEDPDEVFEVLEEVEKQGRNESNHEEETGGDLLSTVDLSYVSFFSSLDDHHEPPLLPPMNDLVSGPSCGSSSYPAEEAAPASSVTFDKGTATIHVVSPTSGTPDEANKTIEGGTVPEVKKAIDQGVKMENIVGHDAATPAKPVLEKVENNNELQATMNYMSGFAPNSLLYVFVISFSAVAYVLVKLFFKRRRARRSPSSNVNVGCDEGTSGASGEMMRTIRSRSVEGIEQVEEGLPRIDPVAPFTSAVPVTPLITDRSAGVELLSEFKVGGGVGRRRSEIADRSVVYNNVNTEEKSRSKVGAGLSGGVVQQQPFTSTVGVHSYGSFIGQEFVSVGKVNDGKGEARTTTPTSVRRSTRIRNRGAKSP